MKKNTLLEKAKLNNKDRKIVTVPQINEEMYEVGVAWAKGEIRFEDVKQAMGFPSPSSSYSFLAQCLKYHFKKHK